jgi:hypothetical protein
VTKRAELIFPWELRRVLDRECSALSLLGRHALARVPRVYVRSDDFGCGVYSFEPGKAKSAVELEPDDLRLGDRQRGGRRALVVKSGSRSVGQQSRRRGDAAAPRRGELNRRRGLR